MDTLRIGIGSDHAGFEYKEAIRDSLQKNGLHVKDFGTYTPESVDYPDYVHPLCNEMDKGNIDIGILLCGSANGVAMAANKHPSVRAAVTWDNDIAVLSRRHNDANVICIPSRFVSQELAIEMVNLFLNTEFEGGRHKRRVDKIAYSHV
ncbi:MAG TPA: ribose 5-phosphate isomerase B [Chitinophagales bacterium]|nr:ribose 5-phosphate isomerase B [Chitinophagales bacterium]